MRMFDQRGISERKKRTLPPHQQGCHFDFKSESIAEYVQISSRIDIFKLLGNSSDQGITLSDFSRQNFLAVLHLLSPGEILASPS